MRIDKFWNEESQSFVDENEVHYSDAEDFISRDLGFCGCGNQQVALEYVLGALRFIERLHKSTHNEAEYKIYSEDKMNFFGSWGAEYFMWYYLDDKEFTEHGSSVPGWLTDKGILLLQDLEEYFQQIKNET